MQFRRLIADPFILLLLGTVALASLWPARGAAATWFHIATVAAIAVMFFLYGVRLSGAAVRAGLLQWRLHVVILACTFLLYPLLALLLERLLPGLLPPALWSGVVFLALLPSTVQSSVAFTSVAGGNVAGAVCSATLSNLLGTVLTPALIAVVFRGRTPGVSAAEIGQIVLQLLVPFALGQLSRPWTAAWASRHGALLAVTDRGSILLIVYSAFSTAVVAGLWQQLTMWNLVALLALEVVMLAIVLLLAASGTRLLHFDRADRIAILFCGSKKSIASGIPIANVVFAGPSLGMTVIPAMLYHQLQLMVVSALAQRFARAAHTAAAAAATARPPAGTARDPG
jgi:solute carrier family 10 (sodium/bile acid cotransporter), member 7